MDEKLSQIDKNLKILRTASADVSGDANQFGDTQLKVDVEIDEVIFERLRRCTSVEAATSEEQPDLIAMPGKGYTVAFDPLDGSSIMGCNFSVGSIFGIWPGSLIGSRGRDQAAAVYAIYGPQTLLVWSRPVKGHEPPHVVEEFVLSEGDVWKLRRTGVTIAATKNVFASANLRSAADNKAYSELVSSWISQGFTLRYTGGMVPDVHHILAKGGGIFCSPESVAAPAKLRLVYECAPLAFIVESAGGSSFDGEGSMLDQQIMSTSTKSIVCLGSRDLVQQSIPAMKSK
ncbi:hypothetical protein CEUSTIGMA_g7617.t1 [Chlamydomonas eustigma]|uniref:Fructose-bisphosphatase n=1 Tax=Chlamydomonas eustigma TaxID=1157962 RepID=A0A250XBB1_9CHLO|nr:hypothetical protein CEUSTIGMA_g7617.t1 [Chlamydomonas eustigma]|eukprot:GAX80179.1 hypothetical protein CEUSTIGMA_g7617.t1 [Chlamydomonas eustigma]